MHEFWKAYDCLMLDLDGVVYTGPHAVKGAVEALEDAARDATLAFVTNNASRTPEEVAAHLRGLGVACEPRDVVTSAQAAAREVARLCQAGSSVLVTGGRGLREALDALGFARVDGASDQPDAVVQGFSPDLGWADLAEAGYALANPAVVWVASNGDLSIPTERGIAPGNGSLVNVVAEATGRRPDSVAGKPYRPLFDETVERVGARRPLVVGDRLDTDIAGGVACGADTLLVLTGVTDAAGACLAEPGERPTYVVTGLDALRVDYEAPSREDGAWTLDGMRASVAEGRLELTGDGQPIAALRAAMAACWEAADREETGTPIDVSAIARVGALR